MSVIRIKGRIDQLEANVGAAASPVSVVFVRPGENPSDVLAAANLPAATHPIVVQFVSAGRPE